MTSESEDPFSSIKTIFDLRNVLQSYWETRIPDQLFLEYAFNYFSTQRSKLMIEEFLHFIAYSSDSTDDTHQEFFLNYIKKGIKSVTHLLAIYISLQNVNEIKEEIKGFIDDSTNNIINQLCDNKFKLFGIKLDDNEFYLICRFILGINHYKLNIYDYRILMMYIYFVHNENNFSMYQYPYSTCILSSKDIANEEKFESSINDFNNEFFKQFYDTIYDLVTFHNKGYEEFIKKCYDCGIHPNNLFRFLNKIPASSLDDDVYEFFLEKELDELPMEVESNYARFEQSCNEDYRKQLKVLNSFSAAQFIDIMEYFYCHDLSLAVARERENNFRNSRFHSDKRIQAETMISFLSNFCQREPIRYIVENSSMKFNNMKFYDPYSFFAAMGFVFCDSNSSLVYLMVDSFEKLELPKVISDKLVLNMAKLIDVINYTYKPFDSPITKRNNEIVSFVDFILYYICSSYKFQVTVPFKDDLYILFAISTIAISKGTEKSIDQSVFENQLRFYLDHIDPSEPNELLDLVYGVVKTHMPSLFKNTLFNSRKLTYFNTPHLYDNNSNLLSSNELMEYQKYFLSDDLVNIIRNGLYYGNEREYNAAISLLKRDQNDLIPLQSFLDTFIKSGKKAMIGNLTEKATGIANILPSFFKMNENYFYETLEDSIKEKDSTTEIGSILRLLIPTTIEFEENKFDFDEKEELIPQSLFQQNPKLWNCVSKGIKRIDDYIKSHPLLLFDTFNIFSNVYGIINGKIAFINETRQTNGEKELIVRRDYLVEDSMREIEKIFANNFIYRPTIKFENENGYDAGGLTRDYLTQISKILFNPDFGLFDVSPSGRSLIFNTKCTKFDKLEFAGQITALAYFNNTCIEARFNKAIYAKIKNSNPTVSCLKGFDDDLFRSLKYIFENNADELDLTFSIYRNGYEIELIKDGSAIQVTEENKLKYIELYLDEVLVNPYVKQMNAFIDGFHSILTSEQIKVFTIKELDEILNGKAEIDIKDLKEHVYLSRKDMYDAFFSVIENWGNEDLKKLLYFMTGSPIVPIGGFENLKLTIYFYDNNDAPKMLPVAHTDVVRPDKNGFSILTKTATR